ncbi:hypothetical protein HZH66_014450 [Vespula vulgaris]|uniref:Uncharacterized protein n=1 Tax=Vespula vulgaris TaxID=7454 RepID=A0A834J1U0_VESVU|nr:hypothetical protein HZH66_014450 [Vespula vulgaris]
MKNAKVKTTRDCSDHFGDHGGYFDVVVRPMLQQGHEGELCGRSLVWNPARIVDKYNWTCPDCTKKQSIREKSFFLGIKCDLKLCLQLILGWCQKISYEDAASYLDIKTHIVKKVYERCDEVSETYVMSHPEDWILGDKSAIVIVDEFPGVCMAEANTLPPRMWLHMIEAIPEPIKMDNVKKDVSKCSMVEEALKEITRHTVPGSYIIANNKARCCSYESLLELKQYKVISVEQLQKFDPPGKCKLLENLETIWQTGVEICEEIQETTHSLGQHIISRYLWRQRFGSSPSTAFQYMLNHIAECFRFT